MNVNNKYKIKLVNSPFVSRKNKKDCVIKVKGNWGSRENDGFLWHSIMRIASESCEILRQYSPFPEEITIPLLKQWGFLVDKN